MLKIIFLGLVPTLKGMNGLKEIYQWTQGWQSTEFHIHYLYKMYLPIYLLYTTNIKSKHLAHWLLKAQVVC